MKSQAINSISFQTPIPRGLSRSTYQLFSTSPTTIRTTSIALVPCLSRRAMYAPLRRELNGREIDQMIHVDKLGLLLCWFEFILRVPGYRLAEERNNTDPLESKTLALPPLPIWPDCYVY